MNQRNDLLKIHDLRVHFPTYEGLVRSLEGVSLVLTEKSILGIVGETGCGKTVTGLSILRLVDHPGRIAGGEIIFENEDLLKLTEDEMRSRIRGRKISMVFQEPISSLNPAYKIGFQITESIRSHHRIEEKEAMEQAVVMLKEMEMTDPEMVARKYPHELSGGMAQRAMIAIAVACNPKLLIADEPTSFLDVTIQAQILELMKGLVKKLGISIILITHDLGVVAETCDEVAIMYVGTVVERGNVSSIFKRPKHPYTEGLLRSVPRPGSTGELVTIRGVVPSLINPPTGCKFEPRCPYAMDICNKASPKQIEVEPEHLVACFLWGQ